MKNRRFGLSIVPLMWLLGVSLGGQQSRTPWGDPDLQGVFTTDDELGVPFERPPQFGARAVVTEEEFNTRVTQAQRQARKTPRRSSPSVRPAAAAATAPGRRGIGSSADVRRGAPRS